MATDIRLLWGAVGGQANWRIAGGDLESGHDLETAILLSAFTDRQANEDDIIPDGTTNRRGWWADPLFGSRLWLLARAKQVPETLHRAKAYMAEAVQWLIEDGAVSRFDITAEWSKPGFLAMRVVAYRPDGTVVDVAFSWAWREI